MPGKHPAEIEDAFLRISDKYKTDALKHKTWAVELIPLKDIHLTPQKAYEKEVKGSRTAVFILLVMSVALLLIGWANALNLTVARFWNADVSLGCARFLVLRIVRLSSRGFLNLVL